MSNTAERLLLQETLTGIFPLPNISHGMKPFLSTGASVILVSLLASLPALAQTPGQIEQARQRSAIQDFQQQVPLETGDPSDELQDSEEALETPGDLDLGIQLIMKPKDRERPLRLFATLTEFYTNNVGLAENHPESDTYLFAEIGGRYETKLSEKVGFEATVRQAIFRYGKFSGSDFESLNAGFGIGYKVPELADVTVFSRYNCERLTNEDFGNEFFLNQTLSFGAQKSWVYKETNLFYIGYASIFGFSDPKAAERDEHGLFGGAHVRLTERFHADLYCRCAYFDFQSGQNDLNVMIVPSLTYQITPQCELNASFSFVTNHSNHSRFDYNAVTTGGGINLKFQF
jgi:hypothetical protein